MSDRETIVQTLKAVESRIRTNRLIGRIATGLSGFVLAALIVKVLDLAAPFPTAAIRVFWVVWFGGLAAFVFWSSRDRGSLSDAAAEVDQKAKLKDEITSAFWFLGDGKANPWIDLQVHRAAQTAQELDPSRLYPRVIPRTSYLAAAGIVLLLVLNFAPLPFGYSFVFSREAPELTLRDRSEELLDELEQMIEDAEALQQDEVVEQLQELIEALKSGELTAADALEELAEIQDRFEEGNLDIASIMEGLEEIGTELSQSDDTQPVGEALARQNLQGAADELRELAEQIGQGAETAANLEQTLENASENVRPGLEDLAEQLGEAADGVREENDQATGDALNEAARELEELADKVASQQLKNEAADQMEQLQEALEEQERQDQEAAAAEAAEQGQEGQPEEGSQVPGEQPEQMQMGEPGEQGQPGQPSPDQPTGDMTASSTDLNAPPEFAPGEAGTGQMSEQVQPPDADAAMNFDATGTGQMPSGFGFSPDEKEGAPTTLDVLLEEETTEAQSAELEPEEDAEKIEEASKQQRSKLDYRNVPSELTPAQQELLHQDRIPREYRNLIKEYFQAIRPRPQP